MNKIIDKRKYTYVVHNILFEQFKMLNIMHLSIIFTFFFIV